MGVRGLGRTEEEDEGIRGGGRELEGMAMSRWRKGKYKSKGIYILIEETITGQARNQVLKKFLVIYMDESS